ncbi:MAG: hypothetical protein WB661_01655 [Candidatus Bathyarchaeia archaeon]
MPKYDGDEVEVRIGTSASNVSTAPALTNLESISWNEDPKVVAVAVGIGSQATEVHDKLVEYAGTISRWHDELSVVSGGTGTLAKNVGAFTNPKVPLWIEVKNKTTSRKVTLNNCLGKYTNDLKSPDGFLMEAWDFKFNTATESPSS